MTTKRASQSAVENSEKKVKVSVTLYGPHADRLIVLPGKPTGPIGFRKTASGWHGRGVSFPAALSLLVAIDSARLAAITLLYSPRPIRQLPQDLPTEPIPSDQEVPSLSNLGKLAGISRPALQTTLTMGRVRYNFTRSRQSAVASDEIAFKPVPSRSQQRVFESGSVNHTVE